MSTDLPDPASRPPQKPSTSPPLADTIVRPFTSQGSTSPQPLTYAAPRPSDRPSSARNSLADPPFPTLGPYTSASARTSYTRVDVDVDSLPVRGYPPLPPLPAAFAVPALTAPASAGATTLPTATPMTAATPTSEAPTNGTHISPTEPPIPQTPQVALTFLLVSGLRKIQSFDPETTVGRVKELVWNAWPARDADWQDERPPAPSYLRILYLGKILQDDDTLLRLGFPTSLPSAPNTTPTIVHLSIRPYALPSDDPTLSKKRRFSIAIGRQLSAVSVSLGDGGRDVEPATEAEVGRAGCCTGCTIC